VLSDESGTGAAIFAGGALGAATATTPAADDSDTSVATTAYVQGEINGAGGTGLSCSGGTCNVALGTTIETGEITDGTIDALDLVAEARSESCGHLIVEDPLDTDEWTLRLPPWAGTITRVDCEAYGGTSITIKVCDGEDRGDDTCATNLLDATETTTLACTTSGASDSTINAGGFAARDKVTYVLTAVSGVVAQAEIQMTCRRD
jgi:hypothetical protein